MSWKEFISDIVRAILSWPVAAVIILLLLLNPIDKIIDYADSLTYKDFTVSFEKDFAKIKKEATISIPNITIQSVEGDRLHGVATWSPVAAVMESWNELSIAAKLLILKHDSNIKFNQDTPYKHIEILLTEKSLLSVGQIKIFHDLRILRNKVVHVPQYVLNQDQAIEYVDLALSLAKLVKMK